MGFVAYLADTAGIGAFAIVIAFCKTFNFVKDKDIPAMVNGAQVLPGLLEAWLFVKIIHIPLSTLLPLIMGCCAGGIISGYFVSRLSSKHIRLGMSIAL